MELRLKPLSLGEVRVTDPYCVNAFSRTCAYLLSLQTGRLLAGFYENAGIPTPYVRYGGWESGLLGGHTLGHILTALSQAYVQAEEKEVFLSRIETLVDGLERCQMALGSGLVWGAPALPEGGVEGQFDNVERGKTDIEREAWVPYYTLHKLIAGLLDVHLYTGSGKALAVAAGVGRWVARRALGWDRTTAERVLSVEYGGMNDCLYTLYARTGEEDFARAAHVFDEEALFDDILSGRADVLDGLHANTTVPKIFGAFRRYEVMHGRTFGGEGVDASRYLHVAETFFRTVTELHAYATGGVSEWERFGKDAVLDSRRTNCNCETCVSYNLLKLARGLFCATGGRRYADYYDRTFVNSILASQDPETGMTTYFQPMASGYFKVFSRPYDDFWCCTGSGTENFTKLGDGVFYGCGGSLVVARYLAAEADWKGGKVSLCCDFPLSDRAKIVSGVDCDLLLRIPDWADGEIEAERNGRRTLLPERGGFLAVSLKAGEELVLRIPVSVSLIGLPDGKDAFAFRYGGAVLSADLGTEDMHTSSVGVDVAVPARSVPLDALYFDDIEDVLADPSAYLVREGERFFLRGADRPLEFGLHYKRYRERYAIYLRFAEYVWEDGKRKKRT